MTKISFLLCTTMAVLLSFEGHCIPHPNTWYVGAKAGWVSASNACESHFIDCDDDTAGVGLFGGYIISDWLAFEAGYDYLGKIKSTYPALGVPTQVALYEGEMKGLEFVAKPYWQINDSWSVFSKAGTLHWKMEVTGNEINFTYNASDSGWSPLLGAGMKYDFNRNWSAAMEYQWINNVGGSDTGGADLSIINLGVIYRFTPERTPTLVASPVAPTHPPAPAAQK